MVHINLLFIKLAGKTLKMFCHQQWLYNARKHFRVPSLLTKKGVHGSSKDLLMPNAKTYSNRGSKMLLCGTGVENHVVIVLVRAFYSKKYLRSFTINNRISLCFQDKLFSIYRQSCFEDVGYEWRIWRFCFYRVFDRKTSIW